jgi:hypothetical protein
MAENIKIPPEMAMRKNATAAKFRGDVTDNDFSVAVRQLYSYDLDQNLITFLSGQLDIQNMLRAVWRRVGRCRMSTRQIKRFFADNREEPI